MTNLRPARAGFSGHPVAENGTAAREVRDALAIGPHSAIDQFEERNTVPRAADARGGLEDDRAGNHNLVCSRADHRTYDCCCRTAWTCSWRTSEGIAVLGRADG